jgi:hypothetical protein
VSRILARMEVHVTPMLTEVFDTSVSVLPAIEE